VVYHLGREISEAGHKILLLISKRGEKGLSFNELRRPPYRSNPKTLAHQLRQLHSWRLISRRAVTVRGGKQYRYTLTPLGEEFLRHPASLNDLDATLHRTLTRILGCDSKIENQLLAVDLATNGNIRYQVRVSIHLTLENVSREVRVGWEKSGEQPIHASYIDIS